MVRGRLRTPQTVVDDPGRVCAGGRSGGWSGTILVGSPSAAETCGGRRGVGLTMDST